MTPAPHPDDEGVAFFMAEGDRVRAAAGSESAG